MTKPAEMPEGYFGWSLLDGERGMITLKDALHNLSCRENGEEHEHSRGVLVGVVSTLCACGMSFGDAMMLVWQLSPGDIHSDRIPQGWESYFFGKIAPTYKSF